MDELDRRRLLNNSDLTDLEAKIKELYFREGFKGNCKNMEMTADFTFSQHSRKQFVKKSERVRRRNRTETRFLEGKDIIKTNCFKSDQSKNIIFSFCLIYEARFVSI